MNQNLVLLQQCQNPFLLRSGRGNLEDGGPAPFRREHPAGRGPSQNPLESHPVAVNPLPKVGPDAFRYLEEPWQGLLDGRIDRKIGVAQEFEPPSSFSAQVLRPPHGCPAHFQLRQTRQLRKSAEAEGKDVFRLENAFSAPGVGGERVFREDLIPYQSHLPLATDRRDGGELLPLEVGACWIIG